MSSANFAAFRALVLRDAGLQDQLRPATDWDAFVSVCAGLASRCGCPLSPEELVAARREARAARFAVDSGQARPPVALDALVPRGWTPIDFALTESGPTLEWCDLRGLRFDDPFFSDTVQRGLGEPYRLLFRPQTGVGAATEIAAGPDQLELSGLIFHTSRCGSTLVCRMLGETAGTVALSEPPPIDQVLRASGVDEATRRAWLLAVVGALGQRRSLDERRIVLKLDAWATRDLPLIRDGFRDTPWIFLYREPAAVVASQRQQPGRPGAPGMLPPALFGLDLAAALAMPRDEYCALVVATLCEDALAELPDGGLAIAYEQLPAAVHTHVLSHFGIVPEAEALARMRAAAGRDAKRPYQAFDPAMAAREQTPAVRSAAERFAGTAYARLEALRVAQPDPAGVAC